MKDENVTRMCPKRICTCRTEKEEISIGQTDWMAVPTAVIDGAAAIPPFYPANHQAPFPSAVAFLFSSITIAHPHRAIEKPSAFNLTASNELSL